MTNDKKLNKIIETLAKEIAERKQSDKEFSSLLDSYRDYARFSGKDARDWAEEIKKSKEEMSRKIQDLERLGEKLNKIESNLITNSIQIVSVIVAILAVVLTIAFLASKDYSTPANFVWIPIAAIIYFGLLSSIWFYLWLKKNHQ